MLEIPVFTSLLAGLKNAELVIHSSQLIEQADQNLLHGCKIHHFMKSEEFFLLKQSGDCLLKQSDNGHGRLKEENPHLL